ncbi:MAG: SseB family protein [Silicimonas sp.]|nr:SseB family protein [Silicimonas sp.]
MTPLDLAHGRMTSAPDDDAARLRFFERLADSELYLLLQEDGESPQSFETSDGIFVLGFDEEARLAQFAGGPADYAALSGRGLASMLAGQNVGLALNPEVAPSSMLIPAEAMDWLAQLLSEAPEATEDRAEAFHPPSAPPRLIQALDAKLASAAGLASHGLLADATYAGGRSAPVLALVAATPGAETALAQAVSEAVIFSGLEDSAVDLIFLDPDAAVTAQLARVALRIDLPEPEAPAPAPTPAAPGMDPEKPPKLR